MSTMSYRFVDRSLFVCPSGGTELQVDFAWPIAEVLDFKDVLVVRIDPDTGTEDNENVYAVDSDAHIVWQVPTRTYVYDDSPYTGMKSVGSNVKLFNWDGTELLIDPLTGGVIKDTYGK